MKVKRWSQLPEKENSKYSSRPLKIILMRLIGHPISLQHLCRTKRLYIYATCVVALISWTAWYCQRNDEAQTQTTEIDFDQKLKDDLKHCVIESKGEGCVIPKLDPFDKDAMKYEKTLPTGVCKGKDWVECFMDECFVTDKIRKHMNVSCVYRDIIFVDSLQHHMGPPTELSGNQKYLLRQSDHVQVSCHGTIRLRPSPPPPSFNKIKKKETSNIFFAKPNSNIVFLDSDVLNWSGHKTGLRRVPLRKRSSGGPRLNVLMLCLNAMSKNAFIRRMPESHAALEKMGAVILNGYNIVEDVPSAALFPILTGNQRETRKSFTKDSIDEDSFIFSRLSRMGYRTAFFEDTPVLGTFKGTFSGFEKPPTDHYLLPFLLEEREIHSRASNQFCIGDIPLYGLLLNLTYQFSKLNGNRFSFTFISDVGRDDFNMRSAADADLALFLRRIQRGKMLEDTVLFVMGDHGPRLTPFRETHQGKLEERLPLMAIVIPERLKRTRPEDVASMEANVDVLTTPFDIHTTLTDLLLMEFRRNRYKVPGADMERGLTLLRQIPPSRSCGEAGVLPHWCACAPWQPLDPRDPLHKVIGSIVADYINSLTNEWRRECLVRKLISVEQVLLLTPNNKLMKYKTKLAEHGYFGGMFKPRSKTYQATIVMGPGRAVFESTLKYFVKGDYFVITEGNISRINTYANDSACIKSNHPYLSKLCFCR